MITTIFFDIDGVLTTEKNGIVLMCYFFAKKLGVDPNELSAKLIPLCTDLDTGKITCAELWQNCFNEHGKKFNLKWLKKSYLTTPVDKKIVTFAYELKKNYKIGIITDNVVDRIEILSKKYKWNKIFDPIIISAVHKTTKHGTELFDIACRKAGVMPNECIFIDNSKYCIDACKKAGLTGVFFDDKLRDYDTLFARVRELLV